MPFDIFRARPLLQNGDFCKLFIEALGWEPSRIKLTLRAADRDFAFTAIAEKRGFTAWVCASRDGGLPQIRCQATILPISQSPVDNRCSRCIGEKVA